EREERIRNSKEAPRRFGETTRFAGISVNRDQSSAGSSVQPRSSSSELSQDLRHVLAAAYRIYAAAVVSDQQCARNLASRRSAQDSTECAPGLVDDDLCWRRPWDGSRRVARDHGSRISNPRAGVLGPRY